jgi:hypothetical protein
MWTQADTEYDADASEFMLAQKRTRRKWLIGVTLGVLVWAGSGILFSVARSEREYERVRAAYLKANGCTVTSHRDSDWKYHPFGDYWEHIPGETCYSCTKVDPFCEDE